MSDFVSEYLDFRFLHFRFRTFCVPSIATSVLLRLVTMGGSGIRNAKGGASSFNTPYIMGSLRVVTEHVGA